ncbi:hypothetical protein R5W24_003073 [Gemmata sp. JC717]|uniref:Uncharacterized protein n=1 Tax=Gemmata algarum TaxID=2975278 RepID=A0ABU5F476_9BACT|nr:hypothetical protein [Gemmata algarum]MDY3553959.1 hypothetical protein [Gemmata algarum]MDY3561525.1 hypothetical protein [Gemmata algarum]
MRFRLLAVFALVLAPLAVRAADEENPYKSAKVGDFAEYKLTTKVGDLSIPGTMRQVVTEKTDKELTLKIVSAVEFGGQKKENEQTQKIDLTKPFDPTKGGAVPGGGKVDIEKLKDGKEKVKIDGKEYDTSWTTYKAKMKVFGQDIESEMKVWTSKDMPLGMLKMTMTGKFAGQDMESAVELTKFGNKKEKE